jgi:hypothetical protein
VSKITKHILQGLFIALVLLIPDGARAQQNMERWGITTSVLGGYVWAHTGEVDNLKAHVYGGTIGFRFQTANRRQWHRIYNHPAWGIDFLYLNYGTPNILGATYGVLPFMEFPFFRVHSLRFNLKVSTGLGYITQPFDLHTNVSNNTIGSHINGHLGLHGIINIPLTKNNELQLSGGLTHFSNGNFKMPNLGVNTPEIKIGYTRYFGSTTVNNPLPNSTDTGLNTYSLSLAIARKYTDYIFPHKVLAGIAQFKYLRRLSTKSKLGGGLDVFYDEGNFYADNRTGIAQKGSPAQALEVGLKAAHELNIGNLVFVSDIGAYLYNKNKVKGTIYQRLGLRYQISSNTGIYTALKVHFARADYFEWGLTYRLNKH